MPQITPDDLELQRDSIRGSLNEINNDIAMEMRDAGFGRVPVYLVTCPMASGLKFWKLHAALFKEGSAVANSVVGH